MVPRKESVEESTAEERIDEDNPDTPSKITEEKYTSHQIDRPKRHLEDPHND